MHRTSRRVSGFSRAFTLIEVLVVVAIIALLIAILIPSLKKARQRARNAACLANLKSIGTSMGMYASAHRGWLPVGPADRLAWYNPDTGVWDFDKPFPGARLTPVASCGWGGKRGKVIHDWEDRPETSKRPLTNYLYKGAGLDTEMPLFQCPDDLALPADRAYRDWIGDAYAQWKDSSAYEICGNSYWINPWDPNKPLSPKRYNIPSAVVVAMEAPMYFSVSAQGKPAPEALMGWHGTFARHNMVFLDFHAANLYIDPSRNGTVGRKDPRRWQGPGWYVADYFTIMDYYR